MVPDEGELVLDYVNLGTVAVGFVFGIVGITSTSSNKSRTSDVNDIILAKNLTAYCLGMISGCLVGVGCA